MNRFPTDKWSINAAVYFMLTESYHKSTVNFIDVTFQRHEILVVLCCVPTPAVIRYSNTLYCNFPSHMEHFIDDFTMGCSTCKGANSLLKHCAAVIVQALMWWILRSPSILVLISCYWIYTENCVKKKKKKNSFVVNCTRLKDFFKFHMFILFPFHQLLSMHVPVSKCHTKSNLTTNLQLF